MYSLSLCENILILINVSEKTLLTMGTVCSMVITTRAVKHIELSIGKSKTSPRKEFLLAPIRKIVILVPAYPNYDAIPNI